MATAPLNTPLPRPCFSSQCLTVSKVICCHHSMQQFFDDNSDHIAHVGSSFRCSCKAYGTVQIYFCFCPHCLRDTQCHGNVEKLNQKFYKYCVVEDDIKKLIFRGSSRFSNCRETKAPIFFIPRLKFIAGNH